MNQDLPEKNDDQEEEADDQEEETDDRNEEAGIQENLNKTPLRRSRGRPRILRTGQRGRPRKLFNEAIATKKQEK